MNQNDKVNELSSNTNEFGKRKWTEEERNIISNILKEKIPSQYITKRDGPSKRTLSYIQSWQAIELANEVFGYDGWSDEIIETTTEYRELPGDKVTVGCTARVKVTLKDGTHRQDVGEGSKTGPLTKMYELGGLALKEAVSDARKRALKCFGNYLGNSLYDKEYLIELESDDQQTKKQKIDSVVVNSSKQLSQNQRKYQNTSQNTSQKMTSNTTQNTTPRISPNSTQSMSKINENHKIIPRIEQKSDLITEQKIDSKQVETLKVDKPMEPAIVMDQKETPKDEQLVVSEKTNNEQLRNMYSYRRTFK